jgi:NRPS condensation-like uncharacterized protein
VDRLFLRMEGVQGRSQLMGCLVLLAGSLDPERLRGALEAMVAEQPLLRTRVIGTRRVAAAPQAVLLTGDAEAERAFAARKVDLAAEPPYGLFHRENRLLLSVHHSVMDGAGAVFFFDRLAAHYAGAAAPVAPTSRSYRDYFRRLSGPERFQAIKGLASSLSSSQVPAAARFVEGAGAYNWHELLLDPEPLKAHGAKLNDLLLAAAVVAAQRAWPQEREVRVYMTTSLREGEPVDLANRSADFEVTAPATAELAVALAAVQRQTPAARDRVASVIRIFQRGAASYLPAAVVRRAMDELHARPENLASSLFFSNVGDLKGQPRAFGDVAVEAVGFLPPLLSPPGVAVLAATTRGRLLITVCGLGDVAPLARELAALL